MGLGDMYQFGDTKGTTGTPAGVVGIAAVAEPIATNCP